MSRRTHRFKRASVEQVTVKQKFSSSVKFATAHTQAIMLDELVTLLGQDPANIATYLHTEMSGAAKGKKLGLEEGAEPIQRQRCHYHQRQCSSHDESEIVAGQREGAVRLERALSPEHARP